MDILKHRGNILKHNGIPIGVMSAAPPGPVYPTDSLLAYWPLQENGNDAYGSYNLTLSGTVTYEASPWGYASKIINSSNRANNLSTTALNVNATYISWSFWFKYPTGYTSTGCALMAGVYNSFGSYALLSGFNGTNASFFQNRSGYGAYAFPFTISNTGWNHIVFCINNDYSPRKYDIYVNGTKVLDGVSSSTYFAAITTNIFKIADYNSYNLMSDLFWYDKILSQSEVTMLYNQHSGLL